MPVCMGRNVEATLHTHHALEIVMAFGTPFLLFSNPERSHLVQKISFEATFF
jgi:hypothetical protein